MNNMVNYFMKSTNSLEVSYIIPLKVLDEQKPFVMIEVPFCDRKENKSKKLIKIFYEFSNNN